MNYLFLLKFIKFCAVGFSGMFVDFGVTFLLKEKAKINRYIANSCGFALAATSNYVLNRIWTFESANEKIVTEYLSFFVIALVGLLLNNLILWLLHSKLKWNFYFSKIMATLVVTLWNFGMNFFITFANS